MNFVFCLKFTIFVLWLFISNFFEHVANAYEAENWSYEDENAESDDHWTNYTEWASVLIPTMAHFSACFFQHSNSCQTVDFTEMNRFWSAANYVTIRIVAKIIYSISPLRKWLADCKITTLLGAAHFTFYAFIRILLYSIWKYSFINMVITLFQIMLLGDDLVLLFNFSSWIFATKVAEKLQKNWKIMYRTFFLSNMSILVHKKARKSTQKYHFTTM